MHHHVCPRNQVPSLKERSELEGWSYTIEPEQFENQLQSLVKRGFNFVSMPEYVKRCAAGQLSWGTVTVTFDDGWQDNYDYAYPILKKMGVPATVFVVSGEMASIAPNRRMGDSQLRELASAGFTIGAHSRSHSNLTLLPKPELQLEIAGCKNDLEQRLGQPVDFFAYPGGRFNQAVVDATQDAGYTAACSSLNGGANGKESLFWLFRETFSAPMNSTRDRIFLNPYARKLLGIRAQKKLKAILRP